jgi:hypothetical protein
MSSVLWNRSLLVGRLLLLLRTRGSGEVVSYPCQEMTNLQRPPGAESSSTIPTSSMALIWGEELATPLTRPPADISTSQDHLIHIHALTHPHNRYPVPSPSNLG